MPISERLMKPGTFDLQLKPTTPKWVRDILQPFGHIVVYDARVDPRIMADVDLLKDALYVGVLRVKPTPYQLSGAHITLWLGDEEGKGPIQTVTATKSFVNWITQALATTPQPVVAGTVTATGANLTQTFTRASTRYILDWLMLYYTAEYKVRTDVTSKIVLDAGPSSSLFSTTPTVIVMPREGGRDSSGLLGIKATVMDVTLDADSYTTDVTLVGGAGTGTATISPATSYKDLRGNSVGFVRVVTDSETAAGQENTMAASQLAKYPLRNEVALTTERYDVRREIEAGAWLYVYDPEHDLVDYANEVHYRGQIVHPLKLRLYSLTWPVEGGMSCYYRDSTGAYTDISSYIVYEPPGTTLEVGASVRGLRSDALYAAP